MRALPGIASLIAAGVMVAMTSAAPQYQIFDLGVVQVSDTKSYGFGVSPAGIAVGRSGDINAGQAFTWTQGGGLMGLPLLSGRNSALANSANDSGIVVGKGFNANFSGTDLPLIWQNGVVSQLPLPPGLAVGVAYDVNASGVIVGSAGDGPPRRGVIYSVGGSAVITPTTSNGSYFSAAYASNDSGRIVGWGIDPSDQFVQVGIVYDISTNTTFSVGTFQGGNSAIALGVNNNGQVVGSSKYYLDLGYPFIWTEGIGMVAVPLLAGTNQGMATGVNSAGWVVGTDSLGSSYTPFLYDGTTTYPLADLLPPGSGWTLPNYNPSISDNGVIVGTGVHNGATRAYAMVPVPATPTPTPPGTPTPTPAPITTHLVVTAPGIAYAGWPFTFMVSARDQFDNTAVGYTSTVHFTSTAANANLPADSTLTNGSAIFSATINSSGTYTITATDTSNPSITGTSPPFTLGSEGSPTPTPSATPTPPATPTPSPTSTPTSTPTPSPTPTPSNGLPSPTPSITPTATPTSTPTPPPSPTPTSTPSPTPPTQALNLSTRVRVQTGDNVGIGGFIITGTAPKHLLFRGIGPSLGISDALANPTLDLRRPDGTRILANDNWRDTQESEIAAAGIPPTNDLEAAIVQTLDPGSYTIILRGMGLAAGLGVVEIYDLDQGDNSKLANLSTRAFVSTGDNIVIAGFIVGGTSGSDRIMLRGIGPSLTPLGFSNALPNPVLELRDSNGALLISNNDWQDDPDQAAQLTAVGLAPTNPLESGIATTLSPGPYTAFLAGLNNGIGVGLVEVYDLGAP